MSYFNVTILGCGSATPTLLHFPSCQAVRYHNRLMLVDCGEGAQLQMRRYGLSFAKVSDIFLSHLHGDHFLGLPGLLSTMALHDVEGCVTVHTFAKGAEMLRRLMDVVCPDRSYTLRFNIIDPADPGVLFEDANLRVSAFKLYHRVPCVGFRFDEKPKRRHIDGEAVRFFGVPHYMMNAIKDGADFTLPDGRVIANNRLTTDADPAMSYAYCSDTAFDPRVADAVRGVDVVYHEATYGDDRAHNAAPRGHSTAREAGRVAAAAEAARLVIGHYSKTVLDEDALAAQATEEFGGVVIPAREGLVIDLA
ncbi:MAG: ribonuclease Z [Muribaculaceae bacterium]|nr:ribonuclease Z [Muribaculaceae bacterium]